MPTFQILYLRESVLDHSEEIDVCDLLEAIDQAMTKAPDLTAEIRSKGGRVGLVGPSLNEDALRSAELSAGDPVHPQERNRRGDENPPADGPLISARHQVATATPIPTTAAVIRTGSHACAVLRNIVVINSPTHRLGHSGQDPRRNPTPHAQLPSEGSESRAQVYVSSTIEE